MIDDGQLLLYGVFRTLIERNLSLGIADYLDAIRALRLQMSDPDARGRPTRESLQRLCQILWARSSEEARLIETLFKTIPFPPQDDIDTLEDLLAAMGPGSAGRAGADDGTAEPIATEAEARADSPTVAIEIRSAREAGGVPLPYPHLPAYGGETFVMKPQTVVSSRTLAVLWRRYRRMFRTGPRTEIDLDATVAEQCRRGVIERPVLRASRVNRAKLLVLADVSPSMVVWRPFLDALVESLTLSRLPAAELFYFSNVPRRSFFRSAALTGATLADKVYETHKGAGLLIISDAGAARGYLNRQRIEQTRAFVSTAHKCTRAVVWVNPMPRSRWKGTTAEPLAHHQGATFLPLDVPSLIRAIDILRGAKIH